MAGLRVTQRQWSGTTQRTAIAWIVRIQNDEHVGDFRLSFVDVLFKFFGLENKSGGI